MPFDAATLAEIYPEPTGYALVHYRRPMGSDCWWGPFATLEELKAWADEAQVSGSVIPLYLNVDWRR